MTEQQQPELAPQQRPRQPVVPIAALIAFSLLCALVLYNRLKQQQIDTLVAQHEELLTTAVAQVGRELGDIRHTLNLLAVDRNLLNGIAVEEPLNLEPIGQFFRRFGTAIDNLLQIRWIDTSGMERVRVNIEGGVASSVDASQLQDKRNRYYFTDAMKVAPPAVYLSPIDLNIEQGVVVLPRQPTLRAGIQTGPHDGLRPGLLLINYDMGPLLERIRQLESPRIELMLANASGTWLLHPDQALEWGESLGQPRHSLAAMEPRLWALLQRTPIGSGEIYAGRLISFRRIALSGNSTQISDQRLYILLQTPATVIQQIELQAASPAALLALLLLLLGGRMLWRDRRHQQRLYELTQKLGREKAGLQALNSELDQALERQQLLQDELAETRKLSSLGMMVAGVAHELNTPIGGALISTSSLRNHHQELGQAFHSGLTRQALQSYIASSGEGLELVERNLSRAANLVKSFKRLALDRASETPVEFNLAQVVNDLLHSISSQLKHEQTEVRTEIPTDLQLYGYPGVISQILQNLVLNAITYGTAGMSNGQVLIEAHRQGDQLLLAVADNGRGIAPELRQTLFDPFVTSGRGEGHTGLGLHLVHQWVTDLMRGRIKLNCPAAGGTRFELQLPLRLTPTTAPRSDQKRG